MGKNDQAAIEATLGGDKEAYGILVARHSRILFQVAYRITGNEADADDVVQEAFLRGYRKLDSFASQSSFGTWIYRIAVNCALDKVQRRGINDQSRIAEETDSEQQWVQMADEAAGPERLLLNGELTALRETAMNSLTATERTAFVLRHMEDCGIDEIAAALRIAPNAAKKTVFRAVQKLRSRLADLRVTR